VRQAYQPLDDVPTSIRRALADAQDSEAKRRRYQDSATAVGQLPALTMHACTMSQPPWFTKAECESLSALLSIDVAAVYVCSQARSTLPKWHARLAAANRLLVALDPDHRVYY
jgi:hypothetical protein